MRPLLLWFSFSLVFVPACSFTVPVNPAACFGCNAQDAASQGDADLGKEPAGPGQPGPFEVASLELSVPVAGSGPVGKVLVTIFGPGDGPETLSMLGAPYPLVVLSPGLLLTRQQYHRYAAQLASHGLLAVLQQPRAEWNHEQYRDDTRALLGWLITPVGEGADRVKGRVDGARVGLLGHGLGGKLSVLLAAVDDRVQAVLALDPVDSAGLGKPISMLDEVARLKLAAGVPLLLFGEGLSKGSPCVAAEGNYEALFARAPAPALSITFPQGAYSDFVDDAPSCGPCKSCPQGASASTTKELAQKYMSAYFLWALRGRTELRTHLDGAAFEQDALSGRVSKKQK